MGQDRDGRAAVPPADDFRIRCPRLGHQIHFSYCRRENQGIPCFKTLDCWHPYFRVVDYLRRELAGEEWTRAFERPAGHKLVSLVELLEQVKKNTE